MRLEKVTYPNAREVYYNYPASGIGAALSRLDNIASTGSPSSSDKYAAYTYLGAATVVKVAHPGVTDGLNLTYGTGGSYGGFDQFGRIEDQKWENDSSTVKDRFTYGYDRNSNRVYRKNEHPSGAAFSELYHVNNASANTEYDGLDRLKEFRRGTLDAEKDGMSSTSRRQAFTLDQVGNWPEFKDDAGDGSDWDLDQDRTHNKVNEISDIAGGGWIDPAYDAAGNMTAGPKAGDETARLHYTYDAWNRLVKVQDDDGGSPDETIAEYRYDGIGRRIVKLIPNGENWDRTDYYYSEAWQVVEERCGTGQAKETVASTAKFQYVWDTRYIDAAVLRDADTDSDGDCREVAETEAETGSERLYYTQDANFNTTALVATDGGVAERYVYDPYGKVTVYDATWSSTRGSSNYDNEILYAGYRFDPETRLYHVRFRSYHPTLGRWLQRDPAGYVDGSTLYEYVGSGPADALDPSGQIRVEMDVRGCGSKIRIMGVPGRSGRWMSKAEFAAKMAAGGEFERLGIKAALKLAVANYLLGEAVSALQGWLASSIMNALKNIVTRDNIKKVCAGAEGKVRRHRNGLTVGSLEGVASVEVPDRVCTTGFGFLMDFDYVPKARLFFAVDCKGLRSINWQIQQMVEVKDAGSGLSRKVRGKILESGSITASNVVCQCCP